MVYSTVPCRVLESLFKNEGGAWIRFSCLFREDRTLHLLGQLESDMRLVMQLLEVSSLIIVF